MLNYLPPHGENYDGKIYLCRISIFLCLTYYNIKIYAIFGVKIITKISDLDQIRNINE